jgi:NitT/TauT family transport system substrate-binding protein
MKRTAWSGHIALPNLIRAAALAVFCLVLGFGHPLGSGAHAQTPAMTKVRIAINKNMLFFPVWVAKERGLFAKNGVDVEFVEIADGTALRTAALSGSVDFATQVPEGSAVLFSRGEKFPNLVATQAKLTWSLVLAGKYKDKVKVGDAKALKGMTIGVSSRGSGSDLQLQALLKANGLTPNQDVKIVAIGAYANGIAAMEQNRIDGMICLEPARSKAIAAGNFEHVYFGTEVYPGSANVPMGALAALQDYIDKHPDLARRVVLSVVEAESAMVADPDWTLAYAAKLNNTSTDELSYAIKQQHIPALNPAMSEKGWNTLMDVLVDTGALKEKVAYKDANATMFASEWAKFKH